MYELYFAPGAASLAVHWMLIEMKVPHVLHAMDLEAKTHKTPGYLRLNPDGLVPTLMIDGHPYTECAALLLTLADRHPESGLAPPVGTADRMDFYQWAFYCANGLQPAFRHWFYPEEAAGPAAVAGTQEHARASIERSWNRIAELLEDGRTHLLGARLTAVDFLATMLMRWSRNMPQPATNWPIIQAYVQRMRAMPSFKTLYAREGLTEWV